MQKIKRKYIPLISAIVLITVLVVIVHQFSQYSQFKIEVEKVMFNDKWLNITIYFAKLPKEGAEFDEITVDGYRHSLRGITFYTGDRLTIQLPHNGTLQSIPETATLWLGEHGFILHIPEMEA